MEGHLERSGERGGTTIVKRTQRMDQAAGGYVSLQSESAPKDSSMWLATLLTVRKPICRRAIMASATRATGVHERGMVQEKRQELARPHRFPGWYGVTHADQTKAWVMIGGESDQSIVLRDGRTDHLGKGLARWWNWQRKLGADA